MLTSFIIASWTSTSKNIYDCARVESMFVTKY